jgi:hypothetical protein
MEVHGAGGLAATTQTGPWPLELGTAGVAGFAGPWSLASGTAGGFGLGDGSAHAAAASGTAMAPAARTPVSNFLSMVFLSCRLSKRHAHTMTRRGAKANSANHKIPDAEMSSVDQTPDKLTQCEKEKFSLIFGSKPFRMG